nr:winged helix-turn-helix domain-containing protein [Vibrio antiquarius]
MLIDKNGKIIKKFSEAEGNLLFEFISQRGVCLSRAQLISVAWPNTIVVENSLNMAIRKLRAAGIDIETIPRKGYTLTDKRVQLTKEIKSELKELDEHKQELIGELGMSSPYPASEKNTEDLTRKRWMDKYKYKILLAYQLILLSVYLIIESNKPDINCYNYHGVEICTSDMDYEIDIEEINDLAEGKYLYGTRFDDEKNKHYIEVEY